LSKIKKFNIKTNTSFHYGIKENKVFIKPTQDDIYKYKLIHTPSQILYSSKKHPLQDTHKVFLPLTTYYEKMLVDNCGMTQGCYFIECETKEIAEKTKNILLCKLYRFIVNICRWGNFNCPRILEKLPDINISNDNDIYNFFGLTKEEINIIETIIVDNIQLKNEEENIVKPINRKKIIIPLPLIDITENNGKTHITQKLINMCVMFKYGTNIETSIKNKNDKKKYKYFVTGGITKWCDELSNDGKIIIGDTLDPTSRDRQNNGICNASSDMILIKLKKEYDNNFDYIYTYIQENFEYDITNKTKSLKTQLQNFEINL
jgi:hypothetical protein